MKYLIFLMTLIPLSIMAHPGHDGLMLYGTLESVIGYLLLAAVVVLATGLLKLRMNKSRVKK